MAPFFRSSQLWRACALKLNERSHASILFVLIRSCLATTTTRAGRKVWSRFFDCVVVWAVATNFLELTLLPAHPLPSSSPSSPSCLPIPIHSRLGFTRLGFSLSPSSFSSAAAAELESHLRSCLFLQSWNTHRAKITCSSINTVYHSQLIWVRFVVYTRTYSHSLTHNLDPYFHHNQVQSGAIPLCFD